MPASYYLLFVGLVWYSPNSILCIFPENRTNWPICSVRFKYSKGNNSIHCRSGHKFTFVCFFSHIFCFYLIFFAVFYFVINITLICICMCDSALWDCVRYMVASDLSAFVCLCKFNNWYLQIACFCIQSRGNILDYVYTYMYVSTFIY